MMSSTNRSDENLRSGHVMHCLTEKITEKDLLIESRKSLVRRFSARYIVQRDYQGDCKKLFSSPFKNTTVRKSSEEEAAIHIISENRSLHVEELKNSFERDLKYSADSSCELIRCPVEESSVDNQLGPDRDQKEDGCEESELQKLIAACKKAFDSLDVAAENAVQLFSKLEKGHGEEISRGAGAEFLKDAAESLPLIFEKVNAVARLVQCRENISM